MKKDLKKILSYSLYDLYEKYRDRKGMANRLKKRNVLVNKYFNDSTISKLQIGSGKNLLAGWLNTDLNDKEQEVAFLDAGEKFPFKTNSFNYIFSEHVFEHLNVSEQINMLTEGARVLKKNGIMRISTPTLEFLFELYTNPSRKENQQYTDWAVNKTPHLASVKKSVSDSDVHYCYVVNNFFKAWGHQMIHNYESIKQLALENGFVEVKRVSVGESSDTHLQSLEKHGAIISEEMNLMETMVVELKCNGGD